MGLKIWERRLAALRGPRRPAPACAAPAAPCRLGAWAGAAVSAAVGTLTPAPPPVGSRGGARPTEPRGRPLPRRLLIRTRRRRAPGRRRKRPSPPRCSQKEGPCHQPSATPHLGICVLLALRLPRLDLPPHHTHTGMPPLCTWAACVPSEWTRTCSDATLHFPGPWGGALPLSNPPKQESRAAL